MVSLILYINACHIVNRWAACIHGHVNILVTSNHIFTHKLIISYWISIRIVSYTWKLFNKESPTKYGRTQCTVTHVITIYIAFYCNCTVKYHLSTDYTKITATLLHHWYIILDQIILKQTPTNIYLDCI